MFQPKMDFADWQKAKVVKYPTRGEGLLGNQTFVGAGKNGGTPWGLNKPHRNLEFTP